MRILIIGGTGVIGKAVAHELGNRHEILLAGTKTGDIQIDITKASSIENAYQKIGQLDAVVMTTGTVHFGPLTDMNNELFHVGLQSKLMGQINTVLIGMKYIKDNGSFTLTSGILNHDPIRFGANAASINGAIDGFVKSAAIEMPNNQRINVISPTVVLEAMDSYGDYFRGYQPIPSKQLALFYAKSVEGGQTGQVYKAGY
ncbi:MAG: short chain dehydrogenase [Neisseriaceae bacterium]